MKTCSRCKKQKPREDFTRRAQSKDGLTAACTACLNSSKRVDYLLEPEKTMQRVKKNEVLRKAKDPVFRRAWNQWKYAKELGRVPPWVKFSRDMLPKYRELLDGKEDWTIDHIVPLQGKEVSGLHTPRNLQALPPHDNFSKGRHFHPDLLAMYD